MVCNLNLTRIKNIGKWQGLESQTLVCSVFENYYLLNLDSFISQSGAISAAQQK